MKLDNHIVTKLLTDDRMWLESVIDHAKQVDGIDLLKSTDLDTDLTRYRQMLVTIVELGLNYFVI